jgi:hypothetical protein
LDKRCVEHDSADDRFEEALMFENNFRVAVHCERMLLLRCQLHHYLGVSGGFVVFLRVVVKYLGDLQALAVVNRETWVAAVARDHRDLVKLDGFQSFNRW